MNKLFKGFSIDRGLKYLVLRSVIFLSLLFLLPYFSGWIASYMGLGKVVSVNYLRTYIFFGLVIFMFLIFNKKELYNIDYYSQDWIETLLLGVVSVLSFVLYFDFTYLVNNYFLGNPLINLFISYLIYGFLIVLLFVTIFNKRFVDFFFKSLVIIIVLSVIFFQFTLIIRLKWRSLAHIVAKVVHYLTSLTFSSASIVLGEGDPTLGVGSFSAIVGAPCSGIESLTMFALLFTLMSLYDWDRLNKKKLLVLFPIGLVGIFLISILRIYTLMVVGYYNESLALNLFHTNMGWILFVVYMLSFFYITYEYAKN